MDEEYYRKKQIPDRMIQSYPGSCEIGGDFGEAEKSLLSLTLQKKEKSY